ncbi:MAG TPA: ATP-binding cassette domain-containing protein [Candidatus Saccharimonadales bacterium]|nr:ATP-binding cassette domain-containing protein [Candidatus Saccharimonadales bacterium]
MEKQAAAITVSNLRKSFKKVDVLKGVSLEVKKGSIFALLGANGAGKTTTINILTTLMSADNGSAVVNGHDVSKQAEKVRGSISLTGQFAAVDDMLSGRENLELICDLRHVDRAVASKLLKQFDLTDAADRRAMTYSGGMRRRLDIAMSLVGNPSIIFFDEPTTGLDPQSRNGMWEAIKELANSGTTIFLTTQYLEEADQLADKIAILNKGKIVAEGTPSELKKLLPHGQIELKFNEQSQLNAAAKVLSSYEIAQDDEALSLTVTTDGTVSQFAGLLTKLEAAKVDIAEFTKKAPSLDDVFLKVINDKEQK